MDTQDRPGDPPRSLDRPIHRADAVQVFVFEADRFLGSQLFDEGQPVCIGRDPDSDLHLDADTVSRVHGRFWVEAGELFVRDLNSANGIRLNARRLLHSARVRPRDQVAIGPFVLTARVLSATSKRQRKETQTGAKTRVEETIEARPTSARPGFVGFHPSSERANATSAPTVPGIGDEEATEAEVEAPPSGPEDRRRPGREAGPEAPAKPRLLAPRSLGVSITPSVGARWGPRIRRTNREPDPMTTFGEGPPRTSAESVEIIAEREGSAVDAAILQRGQQYVLGHPTPQGGIAPYACHEGLRLVRVHADATADLVFPWDVRGSLRRGREQVRLSDLAGERKYSCLRLRAGDRVEVILGPDEDCITYRLFL